MKLQYITFGCFCVLFFASIIIKVKNTWLIVCARAHSPFQQNMCIIPDKIAAFLFCFVLKIKTQQARLALV
jgi:hypothetical protein